MRRGSPQHMLPEATGKRALSSHVLQLWGRPHNVATYFIDGDTVPRRMEPAQMFMPEETKSTSLGRKARAPSSRFCGLEAKPLAECQGSEERKSGFGPGWGVRDPPDEERYYFPLLLHHNAPPFALRKLSALN